MAEGERQADEGSREVAEGQRVVTDRDCSGLRQLPNGKRDTDVHHIGMTLLLGNSARMENGPGSATNTVSPGPDRAPSTHEIGSEAAISLPSLAGLTDIERRETLIRSLDVARQRYDAARSNRIELIFTARANKVSCHDIGVALGVTENTVRGLMKRAKSGGS